MKKSLVITLALFSATAVANQSGDKRTEQIQFVNQPMLQLEVFDKSNTVARPVAGRKYSVSNKNHSLCWTAWNIPFLPRNNKSIEVFTSPKSAKFMSPDASVITQDNGKMHVVTNFNIQVTNNEFIQRCWLFDKNDPLGKYTLTVQVNDIQYPTQTFELVK